MPKLPFTVLTNHQRAYIFRQGKVRFDRTSPSLERPPAHAGQHTDEVLAEMGFGADEIAQLRDGKAIA